MGRPKKRIDIEKLRHEGKLCRHPSHRALVPLSGFVKNAQTADGYHDYCQACRLKLRQAAAHGEGTPFVRRRRKPSSGVPTGHTLDEITNLSVSLFPSTPRRLYPLWPPLKDPSSG